MPRSLENSNVLSHGEVSWPKLSQSESPNYSAKFEKNRWGPQRAFEDPARLYARACPQALSSWGSPSNKPLLRDRGAEEVRRFSLPSHWGKWHFFLNWTYLGKVLGLNINFIGFLTGSSYFTGFLMGSAFVARRINFVLLSGGIGSWGVSHFSFVANCFTFSI